MKVVRTRVVEQRISHLAMGVRWVMIFLVDGADPPPRPAARAGHDVKTIADCTVRQC